MELFNEIRKSFSTIEKFFDSETLRIFLNHNFNELWVYHPELGHWICEHLLIEDTPLYQLFINEDITAKEDMALTIIQMFYIYMQQEYYFYTDK